MEPVEIRDPAGGSSARIHPELGFNCYEFIAALGDRNISVIDASPKFPNGTERPSGHGIPVLFPFPNRIRNGRFTWEGTEYHLPDGKVAHDGAGNAIHGFCLDRAWRVVDSGDRFVTGEFQLSVDAPDRLEFWPADYVLTMRYAVRDATLEARVTIDNPSDKPLPWGFGTHPYFTLPLAEESDPQHCLIEVPASEEWELVDCFPNGMRRPVPADKDFREGAYYGITPLDDVLTGLEAEDDLPFFQSVIYDESAGLQITQRFDRAFRDAVVYTPANRPAVCIEPYTCVTDAVNLQQRGVDAGWQILEPGGRVQLAIDIEAGHIIV